MSYTYVNQRLAQMHTTWGPWVDFEYDTIGRLESVTRTDGGNFNGRRTRPSKEPRPLRPLSTSR
jgi:hypothetical protein